ncbi:DNA-formamidopyrimidine glycosylase family protein [Zafaria sp. Z1313]|uniref:DNA-formamidopyrimidine glycosylase family protein n=1 Tax=unclassified Zafaria TaxID=2828765 RepID=UPI002E7976F5|nr:DNA-formamidopyrimidine glycosylase family protein [Zafaria sp. J156]MEE1622683.1 DNA-formamidopyrimidine glycosylase family protein [Zafaria sp. J156]
MPEGDSVYRAARMLDAALTGRVLESSDFRVPRYATLNLAGALVGSVVSRGKHLLIRAADLSIHSHLMMDGHWDVYAPGERWRAPAFKARCILKNEAFQAVGFELGFLRVIRTADEPEAVGHLGPDPLGHSWDPAEAERRLLLDPERPIGLSILDQRLVAGIGNIYRCELLFLLQANPRTPAGELPDMARLVELAHQLLHTNKDRARRVTTPGSIRDPYWVYGRGGKPCHRCGTPIVHEKIADPVNVHGQSVPAGAGQGPRAAENLAELAAAAAAASASRAAQQAERDLYYCPHCQPLQHPAA